MLTICSKTRGASFSDLRGSASSSGVDGCGGHYEKKQWALHFYSQRWCSFLAYHPFTACSLLQLFPPPSPANTRGEEKNSMVRSRGPHSLEDPESNLRPHITLPWPSNPFPQSFHLFLTRSCSGMSIASSAFSIGIKSIFASAAADEGKRESESKEIEGIA